MLEVAEIFRLHGADFRAQHRLGPWQLKAMADIEHCRTAYFGGHLEQCDRCAHQHYSYHSCRNRHCPKCHGEQTDAWLEKHRSCLLPGGHFLLTFTLPASLRPLARSHPRQIYGLLMSRAVAALQKLARDPQWVGATMPALAVLHTWSRAMLFHPHVHLLVPAGGLSAQGTWVEAKHPNFLVPGYALSAIFRAKFRTALKKLGLFDPHCLAWKQKWNVHCRHAGCGQKVLEYLGRYVLRIAITNSRLEALQNGHVTFRFRDNKTQQLRRLTLPGQQFIERFLQHILPKGFVKVRTYGLWSAAQRPLLTRIQQLLAGNSSEQPAEPVNQNSDSTPTHTLCPQCKLGHMIWIQDILPQRRRPP